MNLVFFTLGVVSLPVLVIIFFIFYKTIVFFMENNNSPAALASIPAPVTIKTQAVVSDNRTISIDTNDDEIAAVITAAVKVYLK